MSSTQDNAIAANAVVQMGADQVFRELDGEMIILNLATGTYYGLESVGARIWSLLQQPRTVQQLRDALLAEYEVPLAQCEPDLHNLLRELEAKGLVDIEDAGS